MEVKAVIGASYGDEGKGLMTDYFCKEGAERGKKCIVVCTNGGSQRGHTVVTQYGERHVFSHFGSGTFALADTLLPSYYILNPLNYREEYNTLTKKGVTPQVYVSKDCLWSTPYDMMLNQILEDARGSNRHGSCGVGIWETVLRNRRMKSFLSLYEFHDKRETEKREYLKAVREYMLSRLSEEGAVLPKSWEEVIYSPNIIANFIDDTEFFIKHTKKDDNIIRSYDRVVFENGQGLLLDQSGSDKTHSTPSNTGCKNIVEMLKKEKVENCEYCYITRTYITRHGAGELPYECKREDISPTANDFTNLPNPYQGTLRYGKIDLSHLKERILKDYPKEKRTQLSIAITHRDETGNAFVTNSPYDEEEFYKGFDNVYFSNGPTAEDITKKVQNGKAE